MAKKKTVKKKTGDRHPGGRPEKYREEFCRMLVDHMAQGFSFASFGADIEVGYSTLKDWTQKYKEFSAAKRVGEIKCLRYFENVGNAIQTGQLRRVEEEEYARDPDGNVIFRDGKPVVAKRKYAQTRGDGRVWSLQMKNRFRWVEPIKLTGKVTAGPKDPADMTDEELDAELDRILADKVKRGDREDDS